MKYIYLIAIILFIVPLAMSSEVQKLPLKDGKNWAYSITFDDGKKSVYDSAYPIMSKYNYTAGIAIVTKRPSLEDKNFMTWGEILYLNSQGWDVMSHSVSHFSAKDSSYDIIDLELRESKEHLENHIPAFDVTGFVYPYADISKNAVYLVNRYYYFGEANFLNEEYIDFDSFEPATINRRQIYGDASKYDWRFDDISKNSETKPLWLIEYTHGLFEQDNLVYDTNTQSFKDHLEYLYQNYGSEGTDEVWVAPSREVYDYYLVYNKVTIENFSEDSKKIEFYVNMSKVPVDVKNKEITLRVFSQVNKIYFNNEPLKFKKTSNYTDFNVKEGKIVIEKLVNNAENNTNTNNQNNSSNTNNQTNSSNDSSEIPSDNLPKINLTIDPEKIQFNGWTNVSWKIDESNQQCIKLLDPMDKYVFWVCNDTGGYKLKATDLYYAGIYNVTLKATNDQGVSELNDTFEVLKWSDREKNLPEVLLGLSKTNVSSKDSIKINWQSADDSQIIASYIYVVDEPYSKLVYQSHNQSGTITLKPSDLPRKGNYRVYFRAKDSANNWNYVNKSFVYS